MYGVPQSSVLGSLLFSLYINDISTDIDSEIRLFADDCVCYREVQDTEDRKIKIIGMLGKEMGYEISTCQMQDDANNKETNKKDPYFIYSGGNGPRKHQKYQVTWGHYHK